jgi:hypothetical protein
MVSLRTPLTSSGFMALIGWDRAATTAVMDINESFILCCADTMGD